MSRSSSPELENNPVHLMIRRNKTTIILETSESSSVLELKKMIEAILKVKPKDQQLFLVYVNESSLNKYMKLSDHVLLSDYGLEPLSAKVTNPAIVGLTLRQKDGSFEHLEIAPYSDPEFAALPEIMDDMKVMNLYETKDL
ncbi:elongin-B-like [Cardiocondyla obscurior]